MLFNSLPSAEQGHTVRSMKRLPDCILVLFNSLFLIHVILCIIITVDCYANQQLPYVVSSTIIFILSFSSILYILFRLNGFVIFYLWSLFVGISICFIPFLIISILFPIISLLFALIKCCRPHHFTTFITNFWSHSTNHIIFYELVFTVPHTILYHVMLFDINHNHYNTATILLCIIIGIAHWIVTTAYCIYFDIGGALLLKLTHLVLWTTIILQIFAIYFQIISLFVIPLIPWICAFLLFICSVPLSLIYLTYQYRMHLIHSTAAFPLHSVLTNWAIVDPIILSDENKTCTKSKQGIKQNLYCLNHAPFHRTIRGNILNGNRYLECNETDHLLSLNKPQKNIYTMRIHEMGDDECIRSVFEYIESEDAQLKPIIQRRHKSVYLRLKQYFKIRPNQYYKLILACGWILAMIMIYGCYPLIVLINAAVYRNQARQAYIVALFVIYIVFSVFYLLLVHTVYTIQHYCGYITNHHAFKAIAITHDESAAVLSDMIAFKKMVQAARCIYNNVHLSECDSYQKAIIARDIIQFYGIQ